MLFPFNADLPYVLLAEKTFREEAAVASDLRVFTYFEHLDLFRFSDPSFRDAVIDLLGLKYGKLKIDLVVLANESMLDLWLARRGGIAPNAPVVFFDVNIERARERTFPPDVYGVGAEVDHRPTADWLLGRGDAFTKVAVVYGVGSADRIFSRPVEDLLAYLIGKIEVADLSGLPFAGMKQFIQGMQPGSAVIYHSLLQDAAGGKFAPLNALRELIAVSTVPVFVGYDHFVGSGAVGGYTYSIESQTREAARLGFSLLRGRAVDAASIRTDAGNRFVFDHAALKKFGFRLAEIPPDSIVKNRQFSVWELYGRELLSAAILFAILAALVAFLAIQSLALHRAQLALKRNNADLEAQVSLRTADLSSANELLKAEIAERSRAEKSLSDALAERGILLKELNHRIKNNLQIVLSLIRLSSRSEDSEENDVLSEAAGRIEAIANVHESFDAEDQVLEIDLDDYLVRLAVDAADMRAGQSAVAIEARSETGLDIPMKTAASVGLIVNELVTNAYKYAYPDGASGTIRIRAEKSAAGRAVVEVSDEGIGMDPEAAARSGSLGMSIVHSLAEGLGARLELESASGKGTRWTLFLPK